MLKDKMGFLQKRTTGHIKHWKRRYFEVLADSSVVRIWHEDPSRRNGGVPKAQIDLERVQDVVQAGAMLTLRIISGSSEKVETMQLRAGSQEDAHQWAERLRAGAQHDVG